MDVTLRAADEYCEYLTTNHYENFFVAASFVHPRIRQDLARFYAYCRSTDDLGDESGAHATMRLARWRSEVQALFAGEPPVHPVLIALQDTIARCQLPAQPFLDLIAANEQDQVVHSYEAWPQLQAYCMLSAAPVGRIVLRIFGLRDERLLHFSDDVCVGLQLANHAQDVARDAVIGRSYVLACDVREHGIPGAVRELCLRARSLLASGTQLEKFAPFALRVQLALYRHGGLAVCDAIEKLEYRTNLRRPRLDGSAKFAVAVRALFDAIVPLAKVYDAKPA